MIRSSPLDGIAPARLAGATATPHADETPKTLGYFSDTSEHWDRVYASQSVKGQVYRRRMARVLRWAMAVAGPGALAADVGTGAGHIAVELAKRGIWVAAIDASKPMLDRVAQNASRAGVADSVVPMISDARWLELPSAACDVVLAVGLLPWVAQSELALAEIVRITKPDGYVIVTMDNARSLARGLDPGWHAWARGFMDTIRRLVLRRSTDRRSVQWPAAATLRDFDRLLRAAGLVSLEFDGVGFGPFTFLGRNILPNGIGLRVDGLLQWLADHELLRLQRAAVFHLALAVKPADFRPQVQH